MQNSDNQGRGRRGANQSPSAASDSTLRRAMPDQMTAEATEDEGEQSDDEDAAAPAEGDDAARNCPRTSAANAPIHLRAMRTAYKRI